ncbi:lipopolysaccharide biosynthesis protein [Aliamphritea hakodatensis]|uniref:lipopolysaccharide biosynthesis protein n=1 Tax=Aliamphritea hakodatensis TaxID=2895352 RepID=UPI0022FD5335|nr:oligosaccharide flippase family protein [Aliamphritea hakodatensis]
MSGRLHISNPVIRRFNNLPQALQYSLIYAAALGLSKGLALVMVPVATHYLTPADYGRLDVLQTLADLLSILIGMGLAETLYRYAGSADKPEERQVAVANIFGMALCLGGFALVLGQLCAGPVSRLLPGDVSETDTRLILFSLALCGTILVPLAWLRMQNFAWLYLAGTAGRVALQVAISVLLLTLGFGVTGVLSATLISAIVLAGYLIYKQYQDTGIRFDFTRFRSYSVYGGPLIFVGIAGFVLGSFDRWILADSVGTAKMAEYALAAKFGLITAVLIQPFDLWWHARRFSRLKEADGPRACARFAAIGIVIALFAALFITVAGPIMVRLLTPAAYHGAIVYIPWLAALAAVHNITATLNFGAMSQRSTWRPAAIDCSAAALALTGYLLLIPLYQAWGAIMATSIALVSRCLVTLYISQQILPLPYPLRRLTLLAVISLLLISLTPQQPLSWSTLGIYPLIFAAFACAVIVSGLIPLNLLPAGLQQRLHNLRRKLSLSGNTGK